MGKIDVYDSRACFANKMLNKYIGSAPNNIVSDIGAGFGHLKKAVEGIGAIWQPFDYVKKMDETVVWDLNDKVPSSAKPAGIVTLLEVLEHLDNPLIGMKNIASHIEKKGVLILTTPNPQSSKNTLSLFLKGSLYAFQEKHLKENHVFTPWKHVVEHYLKECGFQVLEYAIVDMHYKNRKTTSVKDWLKYTVESFIEYRNPLAKGMSYGIVAKKL